jgi:hypothetical protein
MRATVTMTVLLGLALVLALAACSSMSSPRAGTAPATALVDDGPVVATARYALAPTMTAVVIANYQPGREADLVSLARAECLNKPFCSVGFWTDDAVAPRRLKMSSLEVDSRKAQFVFNGATGLSRTLWDCRVIATTSGSNCL